MPPPHFPPTPHRSHRGPLAGWKVTGAGVGGGMVAPLPSRPPVVSRPGQGYEGEGGVLALRRAGTSRRLPTCVAALGSRFTAGGGSPSPHRPPVRSPAGSEPLCPEVRASLTSPAEDPGQLVRRGWCLPSTSLVRRSPRPTPAGNHDPIMNMSITSAHLTDGLVAGRHPIVVPGQRPPSHPREASNQPAPHATACGRKLTGARRNEGGRI